MKKPQVFIAGLLTLLALPMGLLAKGAVKAKPNIVIIYADDMEFEDIGAYGSKVLTPNLDSIASRGTRFTRAYVSSAVCTPSRYGVLTGRYGIRSGTLAPEFPLVPGGMASLTFNTYIGAGEKSLPQILRENGYRTGLVGKWDLGRPHMDEVPVDSDPADPAIAKIVAANYERVVADVKSKGFDFAGAVYRNNPDWMPLPKKLRMHNLEWTTAAALEFVQQDQARPFFLYFAPTVPHAPSCVDSMRSDPRYTAAGVLEKAPQVQRARAEVFAAAKQAGIIDDVDASMNWVTQKKVGAMWLDDAIGAILQKLDELKVRDNTLILVMSDNRAGKAKMTCYSATRVPLLAEWPGVIKGGRVSADMVQNVDLAATVLKAARIKNPVGNKLDGRDILPAMTGKPFKRDDVYLEVGYTRAVVTKDNWKYLALRFPADKLAAAGGKLTHEGTLPKDVRWDNDKANPSYYDFDQLYDLNKDPEEQVNLAADKRFAKKMALLKKRLKEYSRELPYSFGEFSGKK